MARGINKRLLFGLEIFAAAALLETAILVSYLILR